MLTTSTPPTLALSSEGISTISLCASVTTVSSSVTYTSVAIATDTTTVIGTTTSTSTLGTSVVAPVPATSGLPEVSYVLSGPIPPPAVMPADDASGVVADLVPESDTDSVMADVAHLKFRGVVSENAKAWIRQFNNFCEYRDYNAEKAKQLFKVLLIDSVAVWFDSLPETVREDWTQLQAAFRTRYMPAKFLKYQHAGELFNSKQNAMAVQDYCAYTCSKLLGT